MNRKIDKMMAKIDKMADYIFCSLTRFSSYIIVRKNQSHIMSIFHMGAFTNQAQKIGIF